MGTITSTVKSFYESHPFPDYDLDRYSNREELKSQTSKLFKLFDYHIKGQVTVADIGCGTGQLSNFLALKKERTVLGVDISKDSINKACKLKNKMKMNNLKFINCDLFDIPYEEEFDFVFCLGVLNHVEDAFQGFRKLKRSVKKSGYLILGIYNPFGRFFHAMRKNLLKEFCDFDRIRKYLIQTLPCNNDDVYKTESWFFDQYRHPYEKSFRIKEILAWFEEENFEYINSFPTIRLFQKQDLTRKDVFSESPFVAKISKKQSSFLLLLKELSWVFSLNREGGYSIFLGKRR